MDLASLTKAVCYPSKLSEISQSANHPQPAACLGRRRWQLSGSR